MPSAFSPSFPFWEESFMKNCYYLANAISSENSIVFMR